MQQLLVNYSIQTVIVLMHTHTNNVLNKYSYKEVFALFYFRVVWTVILQTAINESFHK